MLDLCEWFECMLLCVFIVDFCFDMFSVHFWGIEGWIVACVSTSSMN